jgi:hypothetical protein
MTTVDNSPSTTPRAKPLSSVMAALDPILPRSTEGRILLVMALLLTLWGLAIFTFGVPALVWPMKLIVPGMIVALVLLTWGM